MTAIVPLKLYCNVPNEESTALTLVNFCPSMGYISYLHTHVQIGWPTYLNHCNWQQPLAVDRKVQFLSSPPGLQGRVYPQSSQSSNFNVLSYSHVLLWLLLSYTLWWVSSGDCLIYASGGHLSQLVWQLLVTRYVHLGNFPEQVFQCQDVHQLFLGVVSHFVLVTSETTSLDTVCILLEPQRFCTR